MMGINEYLNVVVPPVFTAFILGYILGRVMQKRRTFKKYVGT
jgi:hypothetical protein